VQIAHEKGRQFAQHSIFTKHQVFKRECFSPIARYLMKKRPAIYLLAESCAESRKIDFSENK